jgi:hypothetical protein
MFVRSTCASRRLIVDPWPFLPEHVLNAHFFCAELKLHPSKVSLVSLLTVYFVHHMVCVQALHATFSTECVDFYLCGTFCSRNSLLFHGTCVNLLTRCVHSGPCAVCLGCALFLSSSQQFSEDLFQDIPLPLHLAKPKHRVFVISYFLIFPIRGVLPNFHHHTQEFYKRRGERICRYFIWVFVLRVVVLPLGFVGEFE